MTNQTAYQVAMISLGCPKNQVDAEMLLAILTEDGFQTTVHLDDADCVIVNTCGFIEAAKQESIDQILECCQIKSEGGRLRCVVVTGCLAERYQQEIAKELPEVDVCLGIGSHTQIAAMIRKSLQTGEQISAFGPKGDLPLEGDRLLSTQGYAFLKIAEGCDNCCSYCAIPQIRGRYRSRQIKDVVKEAAHLADQGVKELILVAQDTTRFGTDYNHGVSLLPALLDALQEVAGISWIRLLYCYPERIDDALIDAICRNSKVLPYLDIPIQHCNDEILHRMNRRSDKASLLALLAKLRQKMPNIILRTSLIAGFPGETDAQLEELLCFVKDQKFQRLGCFAYSREEGTPAGKMSDQLPEQVKVRRAELVMEKQAEIMEAFHQGLVGQTLTVFCEGWDRYAECYYGRSYMDAPEIDGKVFFTADFAIKPFTFVSVQITDLMECDLVGEALPGQPKEEL